MSGKRLKEIAGIAEELRKISEDLRKKIIIPKRSQNAGERFRKSQNANLGENRKRKRKVSPEYST